MENVAWWTLRHRIAVLVVGFLVTLALGANLTRLEVVIDPARVLPQDHPYIVTGNTVERVFGNKFTVVVGLVAKEGSILAPAHLARIAALTHDLSALPGVVKANVLSLASERAKDIEADADGFSVHPLMARPPTDEGGVERLRRALGANPVYRDVLVSADGRAAAIVAEFKDDPEGFRAIEARVRKAVAAYEDPSVEIHVAGHPIYLGLIERYSDRMAILFPLAVLLIGLVHWEAFRSVQGLVVPLVTALLAVVWALGIMCMAGVAVDVFNATTPILILAIAAGHSVQILKRYYEEYARLDPSLDPCARSHQAIARAMGRVGPVMLAAGTIAALSFLSLATFDLATIRTFGIFMGVGIVCALVIELFLIPALRASLPPPSERQIAREMMPTTWDRIAVAFARVASGRWSRRRVVAATFVLLVVAGLGASRIVIDNSNAANFRAEHPARQDDAALNASLAGTNTFYVLIEGNAPDAIKDPKVLKAMAETQALLAAEPGVGKTVSIADFVRRMHRAMNGDDPAFDRIPDSKELVSQYLLLYAMSGDPGDFDSLVDYPYRNAVIQAFVKSDSSAFVAHLKDRLEAHFARAYGPEVKVSIGGSVTQAAALTEVMLRGKALNVLQVALVVFVVSTLLFRSVVAGALVLVPLALTLAANFGVMGLLGVPLNIPTAIISALAVGTGADYAIYLTYRLREALAETPDRDTAVRIAFKSAGKAVMYVASAIAIGYSVLVTSWGFLVHVELGGLMALAMIVSALATLTVYPALLLMARPAFLARAAMPASAAGAAVALGLVAILGMPPTAQADEAPSAADLMARSYAATKLTDSEGKATFRLRKSGGDERVRSTLTWSKLKADGVDNMRLTRFTAPADIAGAATLTIEHSGGDDDIWIYLPASRKIRRLAASDKRDGYVGTDFSYGDVVGHRPTDWTQKLVGEETVDGAPCWVVESLPARPEIAEQSGYGRRVNWLRKDNLVAVKGEAYDEAGALLKRFTASDIRLVEPAKGRWQAMKTTAENVQTGHMTEIVFEELKAGVGLEESRFTTRALEEAP
jgi:predicted RND superfamily exporter protein